MLGTAATALATVILVTASPTSEHKSAPKRGALDRKVRHNFGMPSLGLGLGPGWEPKSGAAVFDLEVAAGVAIDWKAERFNFSLWPEASYLYQTAGRIRSEREADISPLRHLGAIGVNVAFWIPDYVFLRYRPKFIVGEGQFEETQTLTRGYRHSVGAAFYHFVALELFHQQTWADFDDRPRHLVGIQLSGNIVGFAYLLGSY